jgi:HEAT repeat protein
MEQTMVRKGLCLMVVMALAGSGLAVLARRGGAAEADALQESLKALQAYDWAGDRAVLAPVERAVRAAARDASQRPAVESALLGTLKATKTAAGRRFACEMLSLIASDAAVDGLAALLPDPESSHYAQLALVRIKTPKAAAALRGALGSASGLAKVGLINALGLCRDAQATERLIPLLADRDAAVAEAAAGALGRIGTPPAAQALRTWADRSPPASREAALLACLDAADRLLAEGKGEEAARLYEMLRDDPRPPHVRAAAMKGLLRARPAEALAAVRSALQGQDKALRIQMLKLAADLPGTDLTLALAAFLPKLPADEQVVCLEALGARGDPSARPAVLQETRSGEAAVRLAALRAMGSVGDGPDVAMLAQTAASAEGAEREVARGALARLGRAADRTLLAAAADAKESVKVEAIRALGARATKAAAGTLVRELKSPSEGVRLAAMEALATVGGAEQIPPLLAALVSAATDAERGAAEASLTRLCSAAGLPAADAILAAMKGADDAALPYLLRLLVLSPSPQALRAVTAATVHAAPEVQDEAVRSLGRWPDAAAIAPLRQVATGAKLTHQVLALRGLARLVRESDLAPAEQFRIVAEIWPLATRAEEKKLLLGAAGGIPTPEAMNLVLEHLSDKAVAADACASAVRLGSALLKSDKALVESAMKKVLAVTKDKTVRAHAERLLRGQPLEEAGEGEEIIF